MAVMLAICPFNPLYPFFGMQAPLVACAWSPAPSNL